MTNRKHLAVVAAIFSLACAADAGDLARADTLLTAFLADRLAPFQEAQRDYAAAADALEKKLLADAKSNVFDSDLRRQLEGASDGILIGDPRRAGVWLRRGGVPIEIAGALLGVLRDVDEDRAGPARRGDLKRFAHGGRDILRARHQIVVLRDGERDAGDVGFLKAVAADKLAADLSGDADDRR